MNLGIKGMEAGAASLISTIHGPLGEFVLPVPEALGFVGLKVLVPKRGTCLPKDTGRNYKLQQWSGHFGLLIPGTQQVRSGIPVWTGIIELHQ